MRTDTNNVYMKVSIKINKPMIMQIIYNNLFYMILFKRKFINN